ncbi:hypothetical protein D9619_005393 [Psilocybe cf. subviscida]|uniref:Uncharacterized protein n=1 Tax=Psilocybe cf. subviscida TaxID=2480587 RepID=A0A8H5BY27_9AGAR|nr:hypothetical protein D9619_005393 [Psilocybe cf. subviscida]
MPMDASSLISGLSTKRMRPWSTTPRLWLKINQSQTLTILSFIGTKLGPSFRTSWMTTPIRTLADEDEELEQLAESLQAPFTAQGHCQKKEIAEVLVGTHNHVKKVFKLLDDNVDVHYGKGAHLFKSASMIIEETFFAQQADLQEAYDAAEVKSKIEELLGELKEDFALRDRLWIDLEKQMNELLLPVVDNVKDTPAQVELTIAKLEKHSKALESSGKEATTSARKIVDEFMKKT